MAPAPVASAPTAAAPAAAAPAPALPPAVAIAFPTVVAPPVVAVAVPSSSAPPATASGASTDGTLSAPLVVVTTYAGLCEAGISSDPEDAGKPNQDAIIMAEDIADENGGGAVPPASGHTDALVLAVFDGHGEHGHLVAGYMRDRLAARLFAHPAFTHGRVEASDSPALAHPAVPPTVGRPPLAPHGAVARASAAKPGLAPPRQLTSPPTLRRDVPTAIRDVLAQLEAEVLALQPAAPAADAVAAATSEDAIDSTLSGCTACVAVIDGSHVTLANVGDSRAVLFRRAVDAPASAPFVAVPLTLDHKPSVPGETRRILLAGGRLHSLAYADGSSGPTRVWLRDDDLPGLAMTRSLGDTIAKHAGVTSTPDVTLYTLRPGDAFIVLASDGLWEFMEAADVGRIMADVATVRQSRTAIAATDDDGAPPPLLQLALDALADEAGARWSAREGAIDDISIVVAEVAELSPSAST